MKHVEIINKIIEAEQMAQKMEVEARDKQLHLDEDLQESTESMRQKYRDQAHQRIESVREREERQTREKIEALTEIHQMEMDNMEELFQKNRDVWVEELFQKILAQ